jgi:hypothetical protein
VLQNRLLNSALFSLGYAANQSSSRALILTYLSSAARFKYV